MRHKWVGETGRLKAHRRNRGEKAQVKDTQRGKPSEVSGQR